MAKPYTKLANFFIREDGIAIKVSRRQAIGIFDREDNLIRLGTFADYEAYWQDHLTMEQYEARKLLPEVPYAFWIYEEIKHG